MSTPDLAPYIEVFAAGFTRTRSRTHPYLMRRVEPGLWHLHDGPRGGRNPSYRTDEWIAHGIDPAKEVERAETESIGRYAVCAVRSMAEPDAPLRAAYKSLGFRLGTTEPFMVHALALIPRVTCPARIERVATSELNDAVTRAAGKRQATPDDLKPGGGVRLYAALDEGGTPIGWVSSVAASGGMAWVSNMYVEPEHRRRRIGSALLTHLLRDDKRAGLRASVLLASHTGAKLYESVGYEQVGELLLYTPAKRRRAAN